MNSQGTWYIPMNTIMPGVALPVVTDDRESDALW